MGARGVVLIRFTCGTRIIASGYVGNHILP
jgi:hypothetical protein